MEVNTNQIANYESLAKINFKIESRELSKHISSNIDTYEFTLIVDKDTITGSFYQDEVVYLEPLEEVGYKEYLKNLISLPVKNWLVKDYVEIVYELLDFMEQEDYEVSELYVFDQEVVIDGPGTLFVDYKKEEDVLIKRSFSTIPEDGEEANYSFEKYGKKERFPFV
ncbi:MAG: hypothetical protein Q4C49_03470 [Bacillota bacterium]|nr:hypothetical protein [Bacillota bacterium]